MVTEIKDLTSRDVVGGEVFCLQAMFPDDQHVHDDPLLAYKAVSDPDTLYYHQATKEPDWKEFKKGMTKEIDDQFANGNFTVERKSEIAEGEIVLPAVWQMKRKRDARTGEIKKYKARLNIDGSRMKQGCGNWDLKDPANDRDTARSRHGYIINYAGCPLLWKSQLQTEIALPRLRRARRDKHPRYLYE